MWESNDQKAKREEKTVRVGTRNAYLAAFELTFLLLLLKFTTRWLASCSGLLLATMPSLSSYPWTRGPAGVRSNKDLVGPPKTWKVHGPANHKM